VVLVAFLFGAGFGSYLADKVSVRVRFAVACIVVLGLLLLFAGPPVLGLTWNWPMAARALLTVALIAPLAIPLGMLFPLGIRRLAAEDGALVAWGWGVNGCASVIGALLATVLAMHFGFSAVVGVALALYALAAALTPERVR
jgi:hypothetical protein